MSATPIAVARPEPAAYCQSRSVAAFFLVPLAGVAAGALALALTPLEPVWYWLVSFWLLGMPHGALDLWRAWQVVAGGPRRGWAFADRKSVV